MKKNRKLFIIFITIGLLALLFSLTFIIDLILPSEVIETQGTVTSKHVQTRSSKYRGVISDYLNIMTEKDNEFKVYQYQYDLFEPGDKAKFSYKITKIFRTKRILTIEKS